MTPRRTLREMFHPANAVPWSRTGTRNRNRHDRSQEPKAEPPEPVSRNQTGTGTLHSPKTEGICRKPFPNEPLETKTGTARAVACRNHRRTEPNQIGATPDILGKGEQAAKTKTNHKQDNKKTPRTTNRKKRKKRFPQPCIYPSSGRGFGGIHASRWAYEILLTERPPNLHPQE